MDRQEKTIQEIRKFNRFYTVYMGFLDSGYLDTAYSIVETRVLFELKGAELCIQSDIAKDLRIDKSYLSRMIARFDKNGLIQREKSLEDKRITYLRLTEQGHVEADRLIALTNRRIRDQIAPLSPDEQETLCGAMDTVILILGKGDKS